MEKIAESRRKAQNGGEYTRKLAILGKKDGHIEVKYTHPPGRWVKRGRGAAGAGDRSGVIWSRRLVRFAPVLLRDGMPFSANFRRFWPGLGARTWYDSSAPLQAAKWAVFVRFLMCRVYDRRSERIPAHDGTKKHRTLGPVWVVLWVVMRFVWSSAALLGQGRSLAPSATVRPASLPVFGSIRNRTGAESHSRSVL